MQSTQRAVFLSLSTYLCIGLTSSGTEAEAGRGNVDTRQPVDASSTSGSAAVPEEVLRPKQNSNENQESHGSALTLSAAVAGEEVTVSRDRFGQSENEMQESSEAPGPAIHQNQEELHHLSELLPPLASDKKVLKENQHTRSLSEGSDATTAATEKSEEFPDVIKLASSGPFKRGSKEGSGQAAQNVNQDLDPEHETSLGGKLDDFAALNLRPEEESHQHDAMLEPTEIFPRKIFANGRMSSLFGGWQIRSNMNHGSCNASTVNRIGPQDGYFGLIDRDGLMHILGFLPTPDLARFRGSFTGARDVVSSHAALEIMERFAMIRVGVREPALSDMSQRRLTFADPAAGVSSPHYGGFGVLNRRSQHQQAMVTYNDSIRRSSSMSGQGARFSRRLAANSRGGLVGLGVAGSRGGSSMTGLDRCNKGIGLVKCEGRALESAFPSLHYLEEFGDLLMSQQKTLPRYSHVSIVEGRSRWCLRGALDFSL